MLLVHPVRELGRFLPVLVGLAVAGTAVGGPDLWTYLGVLAPVVLGVLRYLTTSYRLTGGRVELRYGLVDRHRLSTPLDRVRTVDVTASPIHRLLGLATVRIGTGTGSSPDEQRLDLDGLPLRRAGQLRTELLAHGAGSGPAGLGVDGLDSLAGPTDRVVARLDPRWVRLAPLTSTGFVTGAALVGFGSQLLDQAGLGDRLVADAPLVDAEAGGWWLAAALTVLVLLVSAVLAVLGYVTAHWGFVLARRDGSWHLRRGLLTTRETSIDADRLLGVTLGAPLGLRLGGGRRLSAIVTGLDERRPGSALLVPPAPTRVVAEVAGEVLGAAAPVRCPLVRHGRRARARRFTRALLPAAGVSAALLTAALVGLPALPALAGALLAPVVGLALAVDRSGALGHALVGSGAKRWYVVRSGSLYRRRSVLSTDGIIGWTFTSTLPQRRAGLTTLTATTAGGRQAYHALDVPETLAVRLAAAAVPGLLEQFTAP